MNKAKKEYIKIMNQYYDYNQSFSFAVSCEYCRKTIQRLPCKATPLMDRKTNERIGWLYFHWSCFEKSKREDAKLDGQGLK